jgi:cytochrome c553
MTRYGPLVVAAALLGAPAAIAQQAAPYAPPAAPAPMPAIATLAAQCFLCHGTDGKSETNVVTLAGLPRDFIAKSMKDFRGGQKTGTIMPRISKGYSDAEIDALAAFFSSGGKP